MNQKFLVAIGIGLLIVIAVQSYYLFNLSDRVEKLSQSDTAMSPPSANSNSSKGPFSLPNIDQLNPWKDDDDWNPFEQMQRMQNEMNKIFGDMRSRMHQSPDFDDLVAPFSFSPSIDIKEKSDQIIVTVDLPGSDESNISVNLQDDNRLTISASTKKSTQHKDDTNGNMLRSERFVGKFERTVILPAPVLGEKMKTDYKDGVLTITLPKQ